MVASEWTPTAYGEERRTAHGTIYLEARPYYCDRGRFEVLVWPAHGPNCGSCHVDDSDGFPRYYFDLERAKAEVQAWVEARFWDGGPEPVLPPSGDRPPDPRPPPPPPMPWAEAREMLDRMVGRSAKHYPLMLLQLGTQARAVLAALARVDELEGMLLAPRRPSPHEALATAPLDDEPYTDSQRAAVAAARAEMAGLPPPGGRPPDGRSSRRRPRRRSLGSPPTGHALAPLHFACDLVVLADGTRIGRRAARQQPVRHWRVEVRGAGGGGGEPR